MTEGGKRAAGREDGPPGKTITISTTKKKEKITKGEILRPLEGEGVALLSTRRRFYSPASEERGTPWTIQKERLQGRQENCFEKTDCLPSSSKGSLLRKNKERSPRINRQEEKNRGPFHRRSDGVRTGKKTSPKRKRIAQKGAGKTCTTPEGNLSGNTVMYCSNNSSRKPSPSPKRSYTLRNRCAGEKGR